MKKGVPSSEFGAPAVTDSGKFIIRSLIDSSEASNEITNSGESNSSIGVKAFPPSLASSPSLDAM